MAGFYFALVLRRFALVFFPYLEPGEGGASEGGCVGGLRSANGPSSSVLRSITVTSARAAPAVTVIASMSPLCVVVRTILFTVAVVAAKPGRR